MLTRRIVTRIAACFLLAAVGVALAADARKPADWPQWRGPKRDGVSQEHGLLQAWGADGPKLAWSASGLGGGLASVALSGDRIYTMSKRKGGVFLVSLNGQNGSEIWTRQVADESNDNPSSTPTVDGDRVYAVSPHGDLVCALAADGKEVWRKSFTKDFGGSIPTWKYCESPLVDGDKLICTPGGKEATLVALNKKTGDVIWKCAIPSGSGSGSGYASAVISEGAGVRQYVQLLGAGTGCVGVSASDGKLLWNYPKVSNGTASIPTPIVDGDHVFCTSGYGTGAALLKLSKSGSGVTATEVYFLRGNQLQNHHGGFVKVGDYIFGGHGHNEGFPVCVEMKTGRIVWGGNERGPGSRSAAVVYADGQLYFRYEDGLMALIQAGTEAYKLNGTFKIPKVSGPSWSHPVVAAGKLYLREQDNLYVYNVAAQ